MLVYRPHLKLNTIVYQSHNNFKGYFFDIILGIFRKLLPAKCHLLNNIYAPNIKKNKVYKWIDKAF